MLRLVKVPTCKVCGTALERDERSVCVDCRGVLDNLALVHDPGPVVTLSRGDEEIVARRIEEHARRVEIEESDG